MIRFVVIALIGCSSSNFNVAEGTPTEDSSTVADSTTPMPDQVAENTPGEIGGDTLAMDACQLGAAAACDKLFACQPLQSKLTFVDHADCIALNARGCMDNYSAAGTARDGALNMECAKALPSMTCTDFVAGRLPPPCMPKKGSLETGSPCRLHDQCLTAFCVGAKPGECGKCSSAPSLVGSPCESEECGVGLVCVSGTCKAFAKLGAACNDGQPCGPDLYCASGTCAKRPGTGEKCDGSRPCDVYQGNYCDTITTQCRAFNWANGGQPCGQLASGNTLCTANGFCRTGTFTTGICVAASPEGASCSTKLGPNCKPLLFCAPDGMCQKLGSCGG